MQSTTLSGRRNTRVFARLEKSRRLDERSYAAAPLHLTSEFREQFLESFVAAIDVLKANDLGFSDCCEARNDEAGAGADIGRLDRCAGELLGPLITAALLSIVTLTSAPMRASSLTYEKRALKIDSSTMLVPGHVQRKPTT